MDALDLRRQLYLLVMLVGETTYQTIIDHTMKLLGRAIRDPISDSMRMPLEQALAHIVQVQNGIPVEVDVRGHVVFTEAAAD